MGKCEEMMKELEAKLDNKEEEMKDIRAKAKRSLTS